MIKPLINIAFIAGVQVLSQPSPRVKEESSYPDRILFGAQMQFSAIFFPMSREGDVHNKSLSFPHKSVSQQCISENTQEEFS